MDRIRKRRRRINLTIESVAMTDVVFLLLIFFMLATTFVSLDAGINVELPTGGVRRVEGQEEINLKVTEDGEIFFGNKQINQNFEEVIAGALESSPNKTVIISADKNVGHGQVVEIMNNVLKIGAKRIAIATNPESEI
ncbi:MAG: ExbD/TolR family protein [Candidatus Muiribacteriota bacterium]